MEGGDFGLLAHHFSLGRCWTAATFLGVGNCLDDVDRQPGGHGAKQRQHSLTGQDIAGGLVDTAAECEQQHAELRKDPQDPPRYDRRGAQVIGADDVILLVLTDI